MYQSVQIGCFRTSISPQHNLILFPSDCQCPQGPGSGCGPCGAHFIAMCGMRFAVPWGFDVGLTFISFLVVVLFGTVGITLAQWPSWCIIFEGNSLSHKMGLIIFLARVPTKGHRTHSMYLAGMCQLRALKTSRWTSFMHINIFK